jgi:hypothetical protein
MHPTVSYHLAQAHLAGAAPRPGLRGNHDG